MYFIYIAKIKPVPFIPSDLLEPLIHSSSPFNGLISGFIDLVKITYEFSKICCALTSDENFKSVCYGH